MEISIASSLVPRKSLLIRGWSRITLESSVCWILSLGNNYLGSAYKGKSKTYMHVSHYGPRNYCLKHLLLLLLLFIILTRPNEAGLSWVLVLNSITYPESQKSRISSCQCCITGQRLKKQSLCGTFIGVWGYELSEWLLLIPLHIRSTTVSSVADHGCSKWSWGPQ